MIDSAIQKFGRQLRSALGNLSADLAQMRERKVKLEAEIANLTAAIAEAGHSPALLAAIAQREDQLRQITDGLLSEGKVSIETDLAEIRRFVTERIANLRELLHQKPAVARAELGKHITEITMKPDLKRRHYTAVGEWNLLGDREISGRVWMVAGARNAPNLALHWSFPSASSSCGARGEPARALRVKITW